MDYSFTACDAAQREYYKRRLNPQHIRNDHKPNRRPVAEAKFRAGFSVAAPKISRQAAGVTGYTFAAGACSAPPCGPNRWPCSV